MQGGRGGGDFPEDVTSQLNLRRTGREDSPGREKRVVMAEKSEDTDVTTCMCGREFEVTVGTDEASSGAEVNSRAALTCARTLGKH